MSERGKGRRSSAGGRGETSAGKGVASSGYQSPTSYAHPAPAMSVSSEFDQELTYGSVVAFPSVQYSTQTQASSEQKADEDGMGTTVMTLQWKDNIVTVCDGRGVGPDSLKVNDGSAKKVMMLNKKYLAILSGRKSHCQLLIRGIGNNLQQDDDVDRAINEATTQIDTDPRVSKAGVGLSGFNHKGSHMRTVGGGATIKIGDDTSLIAIGSGKKIAVRYFRRLLENSPIVSKQSAIEALERSVTVASIRDPSSGGFFLTASVSKGEEPVINHEERNHLICYIHKYYPELEVYFNSSMLMVTYGILNVDQAFIQEEIQKIFEGVLVKLLGFKFSTKFAVWKVKFASLDQRDAAFEVAQKQLNDFFCSTNEVGRIKESYRLVVILPNIDVFELLRGEFDSFNTKDL